MPPYRVGIVGAPGLLAKELTEALSARAVPMMPPRLLQTPGAEPRADEHGWVEFGDEAALLEPWEAAQLDDLDVLFLAVSAHEAAAAWPLLATRHLLVVDLSGALGDQPGAVLAGMEPDPESGDRQARLLVVAHPAAQVMALLLRCLGEAGPVQAAATVFEPASQRGLAGIQELEQQTRRMFAMQSLPQQVFGAQVACNLRAELGEAVTPGLADIRRRLAQETARLAGCPAPALTVLQAPIFHATVISMYCRYPNDPGDAVREQLLASPWFDRTTTPDVFAAAGRDEVLLAPAQPDPAGGFWLFGVLDNLRRTAYAAADAAALALRRRV